MAEGGNEPQLGGYDYEFINRGPEDRTCPVCCLTMRDPVQIEGCGHRLCNICMESWLRRPSPTCPVDRGPLSREKIFQDTACHREILDLTVKCPHFGCSWTGELRAVEKHQSECPFKVVKCPNSGCAEKLTKQDLHGHMAFECSWRKMNCEYCQESIIMIQKQEHFGVCGKFPVQCTNKCGLKDIPREKLDVHVRDECPATPVQCEYKDLGCESVFPRSSAKSHSESQVECHLNLALRGLQATQLQVNELVSLVKDQSQQIERLMSKEKEQSLQIERLVAKVKEQSQHIELHKQIFMKTATPFEWIIPKFKAIYERALLAGEQTILSEPFYLFKCGCRYSLKIKVRSHFKPRINMNGVSLCIKVVPGEFDSLLSWPCTEKVRVTLIDQDPCQDNRQNITGVVDEGPCFRPHADDAHEYRLALQIQEKTLRTRSYIKNDTIFIVVSKE